MKRIIAVLCTILTLIPPALAGAAGEDIFVIQDFVRGGELPTHGEYNTEYTFLDDVSWKFSINTGDETNMKTTLKGRTDLDEYSYFNILAYSERVCEDEYFRIRLNTTYPRPTGSGTCYLYADLKMDWQGWKIITIPKSKFTAQYAKATDNIWPHLANEFALYHTWGGKATAPSAVIYLDKVWMSKTMASDCVLTSSSPKNGNEDVSITAQAIKLEFCNRIYKITDEDKISLTANDEPVDFTAEIDEEGNLCIIAMERLSPETEYTAVVEQGALMDEFGGKNVNREQICFKTLSALPVIKTLRFSTEVMQQGEQTDVFCEVENVMEESVEIVFITVMYEKESNYMRLVSCERETLAENTSKDFSTSFMGEQGCTASAMVLICKNGNFYPITAKTVELQ